MPKARPLAVPPTTNEEFIREVDDQLRRDQALGVWKRYGYWIVAAVIGGIGSIRGAVVGGVLLGVAEIGFVGFLPPEFSGYRDAFVFTLLLVVLLVRPNGLFGASEVERA